MISLIQKISQRGQVKALERAADKAAPAIRRAWLNAIERARKSGTLNGIIAAIEAGDIQRAIDLMAVPAVAAQEFLDEWSVAYTNGAAAGKVAIGAKAAQLAFDSLADSVIQPVRQYTAAMVQEIDETTRQGIAEAIRSTSERGLGPRQQAKRARELIGLTSAQVKAVENFRAQLEQQRNAPIDDLGQARPMTQAGDRRLSATEQAVVRRHLREGHLTQQKIDELVERYRKSLINNRAQNIARTESMTAATMGQQAAWDQATEQGILDTGVRRKWVYTHDARTRDAHKAVPGMNPDGVGMNESFSTPLGPMRFPRDPRGTAANRVNCRCAVVLVNP